MSSFLPIAVPATVPTILASTIIVPLFLLILRGIYHVYFSPLSSIPGPWYAAVSEIWILVHTLRCRKVRAIDDLFKAYGPVVRIAPTTIAFLDKDHEQQTTRLVYNALKLDKGPLYDMVHMNGLDRKPPLYEGETSIEGPEYLSLNWQELRYHS
ncbi:uncharacterized protein C8R40DRAFT_1171561 [Lentinula edodes]|uniref:uncharacterized protein n=1 Tax=Lentinula edodes TaxID=5353 RepID=UPI001E8DCA48|nr:uncharacterized protein C8R40DRAFT_1171561 [Lentinula edodes]KAH7874458.1 hypothetical protein C8R40DRAFT_1171561 [Lentinula edodes]